MTKTPTQILNELDYVRAGIRLAKTKLPKARTRSIAMAQLRLLEEEERKLVAAVQANRAIVFGDEKKSA